MGLDFAINGRSIGVQIGLDETRATAALRRAEVVVIASAATLTGLGLVMIYSSSSVLADRFGSSSYFLVRQFAWALVAATALVIARSTDYHLLVRHRRAILLAAIVLLALVLVPGIGTRLNGARRWIRFGGIGVQPSDLARLALVIYLAGYLQARAGLIGDWKRGLLPALVALGAVLALVAAGPDIGTAALMGAVGGLLLLVGGARLRHVLPAAATAAPLAAGFVLMRFEYVRARVMAFWMPDFDPFGRGYHLRQSLIALAQGGVTGSGLGQGGQKLFYLPEAHTDFVLAVAGEELGLIGTLTIVACFAALTGAMFTVAKHAPDRAGAMLATGVALWIGLQACFNIAVVTGMVPTTGIPLPFMSYGGSALVSLGLGLGLVMNVAGHGMSPARRGVGGWKEEPLDEEF